MKKWSIPSSRQNPRLPREILQEYGNALVHDTQGKLTGQVVERISYDSYNRPRLYYSLHVYVNKLRQAYKLFEVEQSTENFYPVNLTVFYYTGTEEFPNLISPESLDGKIAELIALPAVSNLIGHFLNLADLRDES